MKVFTVKNLGSQDLKALAGKVSRKLVVRAGVLLITSSILGVLIPWGIEQVFSLLPPPRPLTTQELPTLDRKAQIQLYEYLKRKQEYRVLPSEETIDLFSSYSPSEDLSVDKEAEAF